MAESLALTTPDLAKQASLLYEQVALWEVKAPLGYCVTEEERRQFKEWCVPGATLVPDKEFQHLDYRNPQLLLAAGAFLEEVTRLSSRYRGQYIVNLLQGSSDAVEDLDAVGSALAKDAAPTRAKRCYARILIDKIQGVGDADWEQIREFRKDKVAKRDYRGLLYLHKKLRSATSWRQADDLIQAAVKAHNDAFLKHGFTPQVIGIQLVGALSVGLLQMLSSSSIVAGIVVLTSSAAALYQLLEARQLERLSQAPALLVKAQELEERVSRPTGAGPDGGRVKHRLIARPVTGRRGSAPIR